MVKLRILLSVITVISLTAGYMLVPETVVDERPYLREIAGDVEFSVKKGEPPHYGSDSGVAAFNTYDIVPSVRGYAGPIKLLLAINKAGEITGIKILEHRETQNYVHYLLSPEYLGQFPGKSVYDPIEIDNDIDAVSRATESAEALAKTIRESSRTIASRVYGLEVKGGEREKRSGPGWIVYLLLFTGALVFYFITRRSKDFLRARDISLVLGIALVGVYLASPFSIIHIFNLVLLRMSASVLLYVIVISTLISIVVAGRFYCGWLCPFGAIAEFIGRIPAPKWKISGEMDDRWRRVKYYLLGLTVIAALTGRQSAYGNYETYVTLFSMHGSLLSWSLVALMLAVNLRVERFWCRYLCPVAAFTGILSRKESGYISRKDCPMANKHDPHISECIRCNRCYKTAK